MRAHTLAVWAMVVGALASGPVVSAAVAPPVEPLRGVAPGSLALRDFRLAVLTLPAMPPEAFDVRLELNGRPVTLRLERYSLRSEGFQVLVSGEGGRTVAAPAPAVRTYRGGVAEWPGMTVAASLLESGLTATILSPDGQGWYVQPLPGGGGEHAVYRGSDLLAVEGECIALESPVGHGEAGPAGGAGRGDLCNQLCEIAFDADYEFFQLNGSSLDATVADIETVMNGVDLIYARDTNVRFEITATVVRTDVADPYSGTDSGSVLNQFRDHWNANHGSIHRDTAHLMTGREVDGNVIGVAWLSVLCGTGYDYGFSQSRFTGNMAYRTGLTAHEVGHNFSAGHCNGDSDCWIMCSGIGGCAGDVTKFGERSMQAIRSHSLARACLSDSGPLPTPVPPSVRDDEAVAIGGTPAVIDVLANDTDANCDELLIAWHETATASGATIGRSVGTGPGGRDELVYTAAPGFEGTEAFRHTVMDGFGISEGWVTVTVVQPRPSVNPGLTEVGLEAAYYALPPLDSLPDFSALTPYATDVMGQVNVPSTDGDFATSGRADDVGAVYEGFLVVPEDGIYRLFTESDDGSRLLIGGDVIVNNDGLHGMVEQSGLAALEAGAHRLRVEFFERAGGAGLIARIEGGGLSKRVIPPSMFLHASSCAADADGDGVLSVADFGAFREAYLAGNMAADFNGNGGLDVGDFGAFRAAYLAGCP